MEKLGGTLIKQIKEKAQLHMYASTNNFFSSFLLFSLCTLLTGLSSEGIHLGCPGNLSESGNEGITNLCRTRSLQIRATHQVALEEKCLNSLNIHYLKTNILYKQLRSRDTCGRKNLHLLKSKPTTNWIFHITLKPVNCGHILYLNDRMIQFVIKVSPDNTVPVNSISGEYATSQPAIHSL